jgi:hypothetical protein
MRVSKPSCSVLAIGWLVVMLLGCSPTPAKVEIVPAKVILEGAGSTQKLEAKVYDEDGKVITKGVDVIWFSEDTERIKLSVDGTVTAVASGETEVEVEVVGANLKATVPIRIKIPASINVSHERLRLWTGQVKENVWAEVHSEKDAFIEGYLPEWTSEDPTVVKVEPIRDPKRRQSWVKMTGMSSGTAYIYANFKHLSKRIRVAVFDEDEEVALDGTRITKEQKKAKEEAEKKKKKKGKK